MQRANIDYLSALGRAAHLFLLSPKQKGICNRYNLNTGMSETMHNIEDLNIHLCNLCLSGLIIRCIYCQSKWLDEAYMESVYERQ